MKKPWFAFCLVAVALLCLLCGVSAKADTIDLTWGEVDSQFGFPPNPLDVGSVTFTIPTGQSIVGAVFTGTFGNSLVPNTANIDIQVNGVLVASCTGFLDPCASSDTPTPFSYTFTPANLLALSNGVADLTITQTSLFFINVGASDLLITTAPTDVTATPEPGTMALLGVGLLGLASFKRLKK